MTHVDKDSQNTTATERSRRIARGLLAAVVATPADGRSNIHIGRSVGDIAILSPLTFTGRTLALIGSGQRIVGDGLDATLLHSVGAVDVEISRLDFTDGGGYALPATGTVTVGLDRVTVSGVGGHDGLDVDEADDGSITGQVSRS